MATRFDDTYDLNTSVGEKTQELVRNLDDGLYAEAQRKGLTVADFMERQDPTSEQPVALQGTDAFQRAMIALDVRTRDNKMTGQPASTLGDLYASGGGRGAVLVPEYITRTARAATVFGTGVVRLKNPARAVDMVYDRFYASNQPVSDVLSPSFLDSYIHAESLRTSLLPLMTAIEEQAADASDYQGFFLTYTAANSRFHRITEGAPPPVYELTGTERTHRMHGFGFELRVSYRTAAQWKLPVFELHLAMMIDQNNLDKEQVAYETIVNGDGTAAAATNTNVSALTSGVASTVTYGDLLEWLRLFEGNGNYYPDVAVATSAVCHRIDISDFGSANHPTFAGMQALMQGEGGAPDRRRVPPYYARSYSTANKFAAWDSTRSLRMRYTAMLQETDRVISNRYDKIVGSEYTGFDILIDGGRRLLDTEN